MFVGRDVSLQKLRARGTRGNQATRAATLPRNMVGRIIQGQAGTRLHSSPWNGVLAADHIARDGPRRKAPRRSLWLVALIS